VYPLTVCAEDGDELDGSVDRAEPVGRDRRLVVTTGLVDELPVVDGLADRWGRDVVHCPYCHGWEVRDQVIGVLATSPMALHQAGLFRQLTDHVVVLRHTAGEAVDHGGASRSHATTWDAFYATDGDGAPRWSGRPNGSLVAEVADLEPGTASPPAGGCWSSITSSTSPTTAATRSIRPIT
jgi:hypothetical protein